MTGRALWWCVGLALWLLPSAALAQQGGQVLVTVDPPAAAVGDTIQYTLRLVTGGQREAKIIANPGFGRLQLLGTSRGTEFRTTPQGSSLSYTFTYTLRGREVGDHKITGPKALIGGKEIQGRDLKVILVNRGKSPPVPKGAASQAVMLRGNFSNHRPYVGEQVRVEYAIYIDERRVGPFGVDVADLKSPDFDGFWIENLGEHIRANTRRQVIEGREYNVRPVQLLSVFPLREGKLTVDSLSMTVEASGRNTLRRQRMNLRTDPMPLEVRKLPSGAPSGFHASNVGQYSFEVTTDKQKVAVGEPLLVRLMVKGTGMVGRLKLPSIPPSDGYRLLEPVESTRPGTLGRLVGGQKTAEIVLTPTREGVLRLPILSFHTFDPQKGEYVSVKSKEILVAVAGRVAEPPKKEVELVERDRAKPDALRTAEMPLQPIRPMVALSGAESSKAPLPKVPLFLAGLFAPPLCFGLWLMFGTWRRKRAEAAPDRHRRSAPKRARASLKSAAALAADGEGARACSEVAGAIGGFVSSALEIPAGSISDSKVRRLLGERGVDEALIDEFSALWGVCSRARFGGDVEVPPDEVVTRAEALLEGLGRALS